MMTFEALFTEVQKLSALERLRLMELLAMNLQSEFIDETDWQMRLRATYGILADDPIERPSQLPLQEREPLE